LYILPFLPLDKFPLLDNRIINQIVFLIELISKPSAICMKNNDGVSIK